MTCTDFVWFVGIIQYWWSGNGGIPGHDIVWLLRFITLWFLHWGFLC